MNKRQAIKLLNDDGWTKADAIRALESIDFRTDPDELTIRRRTSPFAGSELKQRQRLQAAQKGLVTKKIKEIKEYAAKIDQYEKDLEQERALWRELVGKGDSKAQKSEFQDSLVKEDNDKNNIA